MTARRADGQLAGYSASIAAAIDNDDDALLDLVEEFMRDATGGTLDALPAEQFARLARRSCADVVAWATGGPVDGVGLADYCRILGLAYPTVLDTPGSTVAIEV